MFVGLQGSGKTTSAVKVALMAKREGHRPMVVALDLRRPAAVEQLRTLAAKEGIAFHSGQGTVEDIAAATINEASSLGQAVVLPPTPARLHLTPQPISHPKP